MNLTGLATAFLRLLGRLPLPLLHWLSTVLFVLAYYLVRWRTALIDKNLKNAFPDLSATERKKIARSHVRSVIDTTFESLKGNTISTEELGRRVRFTNIELLNDYADQPLFIVGAHQGNWEWQLLALSNVLDQPLEAIYAPSGSPAVENNLMANRSRFGMRLIPRADTMMEIAKRLKEPRAIVLLSDQNPRRDVERCWLPFLNQDTALTVGLDKLASLTRYPIVFQVSRRVSRGHYEVTFHHLAEPPYAKEGSELMLQYAAMLEESIRQQPSDWLWSYDRWRYPKPLYS